MSTSDLLQADPAPVFGASRARVLGVLQDAGSALSANDVAAAVGLHVNTVRFHLDALVEAGSAERETEKRERPGRPRALYQAHPGVSRVGQRSYRLLAEILASFVAAQTPDPADSAVEAGEAWGHYLADRPPPFQRVDADSAVQQLLRQLGDLGFDPEAVTDAGEQQIRLRNCPFRETAETNSEVVCGIHLGLMRGLLDALGAPVETERLDSFVQPNLCVAHLTTRSGTN